MFGLLARTHRVIVQWLTIFQLQDSLKKGFRFKTGSNGGWALLLGGSHPPISANAISIVGGYVGYVFPYVCNYW